MGRHPPPKTKQSENAWEQSGLTGAERDAAASLVQKLLIEGKRESPTRAARDRGVTKKKVLKVLGGLAMTDRR